MATAPPQFSDQRQFQAVISGISGNWAVTSGGDLSLPNDKAYDGGNPIPSIVTGNPLVDDKVFTRNYAPSRDASILTTMKATLFSGTPYTATVTITPLNSAYAVLPDPGDTYTGVLTKVGVPQMDGTKSGAAASTWALTFTCYKLV